MTPKTENVFKQTLLCPKLDHFIRNQRKHYKIQFPVTWNSWKESNKNIFSFKILLVYLLYDIRHPTWKFFYLFCFFQHSCLNIFYRSNFDKRRNRIWFSINAFCLLLKNEIMIYYCLSWWDWLYVSNFLEKIP